MITKKNQNRFLHALKAARAKRGRELSAVARAEPLFELAPDEQRSPEPDPAESDIKGNALEEFHEIVASGVRGPVTITVDASLARFLIGLKQRNRAPAQDRIDGYVRAMRSGHWTRSNDALMFRPDLSVGNGLHRVTAIARAGVALSFTALFNCTDEEIANADGGRPRSIGDTYAIDGFPRSKSFVPVMRVLWRVRHSPSKTARAVRFELDEVYAAHRAGVDFGIAELAGRKWMVGRALPAAVIAALVTYFEAAPEQARAFVGPVLTGNGLASGSPAKALRALLEGLSRTPNIELVYGLTLRACMADHLGEEIKILRSGGDNIAVNYFNELLGE